MAFVEKYLRVPEGDLVGQPIRLAPFQEAWFYSVYDNEVLTRRAILSMARKNSKTATIATMVLVHIVGPEAKLNSRICSGARSRKQAAEVYNYASKMAALSPELSKLVRAVPSSKRLIGLSMNAEYEALSAEGSTAHGGSYIVAILDEVGQIRGPKDDFIDAIRTSQGAYDDALLLVISTQAPTDADLMSIMIDNAIRGQDPATVCHLYTAPEECDLLDEKAWEAANPALGLFRSKRDLAEEMKQANDMPSQEPSARVLGLNQRVNMVSAFVSPSIWKAGNRPVLDSPFLRGVVYGGLDLSATTDLTSLVLTARDENGNLHVRAYFWMPQDSVRIAAKRDQADYELWVKKGLVRTTPGPVIDYSFVARDVVEICADLNIAKLAFDPWRMDRLQKELDAIGAALPLEPFRQTFKTMSPAIDALEADLLKNRVVHGGNPPLTMCAANAVVKENASNDRMLEKSKSTGRIDGMVALVMAAGVEAMMAEEPEASVDDWLASLAA